MPPLTTPRFTRPARGLLAATVVFVGAFGGPVGPAGAGAPAGHAASATGPTLSNTAGLVNTLVTDKLGIHTGDPLTPLGAAGNPTGSRLGICDASLYGSAFNTRLASTWTSIAARPKPCTSSGGSSSWGAGTIPVSKETNGETICRGRFYNQASSIWFKTSRGYIWSGGTANPRWNKSC